MDEPNVRGDPGGMFQATAEGGLDCESLDVEALDLKSRQEIFSSGGPARAIVPDLAAGESLADHEADQRGLDNGRQLGCDRLLPTTGAEPRRLPIPGANSCSGPKR